MTDNQMSSERSSDVAIKFQAAFRAAAERGAVSRYICPICSEPSNTGQELWEHAKQAHPESLEVIGSTEGVEAKELFLDKAYVNLCTILNRSCACLARALALSRSVSIC